MARGQAVANKLYTRTLARLCKRAQYETPAYKREWQCLVLLDKTACCHQWAKERGNSIRPLHVFKVMHDKH